MAITYIQEYRDLAVLQTTIGQAGLEPRLASQTVSITASSLQSSGFNVYTRMIRVHVDATCSIEIGESPTATASSLRMVANSTEYFGVVPGHKLAVITNA